MKTSLALIAFCLTTTAMALDLGAAAPAIEATTLDDGVMTIDNYGERPGTAIVFMSSRCPVTAEAIDTIVEVHQRYRLQEVLFVGIVSNDVEQGEEIRDFCQANGVIFPVYRDLSGKAAENFGAAVTPEVFLLDGKGNLVYHGGIGAGYGVAALNSAIADLLTGEPVDAKPAVPRGTPIDQPGPARKHEDRFGAPAFSSELIFEKIPDAPAHHCSTIIQAANGDLLCLWYGGSYESDDDQTLFLARRKAGQRSWGQPERLIEDKLPPLQPPGNAIIFRDGRDRIWVLWGRMEQSRPMRRGTGWGQCRLFYRISEDNGYTWSGDTEFPDGFGLLPRNLPITLDDGALLIPLSGRDGDSHGGGVFLKTTDGGTTWQHSNYVGGSQPTVVQRNDGSLLAFMRTEPRILMSQSTDDGLTWTEARPTAFPCPGSGITMTRLVSGRIVLVYNDSVDERSPLSVAWSTDDGGTWAEPLKLEANPGEYSYPCVTQSQDGNIHVSYTFRRSSIKHVEFNEDWLDQLKRPN